VVIKIARMLVAYQAVVEQKDEIQALAKSMEENEAAEAATGLFVIVQEKMRRFMTMVVEKNDPSPMDWIFDARSYGMRIRFTTTASPVIDWVGDRVSYQRIQFTINQLSDMLHELVAEMKASLGKLLMVDDGQGGNDYTTVPEIDWVKMEDDHSEDRFGYSFLQDDRNAWVAAGEAWVARQMLQRRDKRVAWFASGQSRGRDPQTSRQMGHGGAEGEGVGESESEGEGVGEGEGEGVDESENEGEGVDESENEGEGVDESENEGEGEGEGEGEVRERGRGLKRTEGCPYRGAAIQEHGRSVERFREGLLTMMHMLGGMPARSTEIMGIRHSNTASGGYATL
jgi:hypothetical protein